MSILIIHASIYIQSFISRICCFCVIQSLGEYRRRRLFFCKVGILFILFSFYHFTSFFLLDKKKMAAIRKKLVIVGDGACGNKLF
jgi:hypothetical protein